MVFFYDHMSTDQVTAYKPDPRAYAMATNSFGLSREEIAFAAVGGWDAAGAKWFGYPTFWVNRAHSSAEELAAVPDGVGSDLHDLETFVRLVFRFSWSHHPSLEGIDNWNSSRLSSS
jgi:2-haloacid dehalogenase